MRRRNTHVGFGKSFDSFLSIVTKNGLGMLILVAMASTFASMQTLGQAKFKRSLGTPIVADAPADLKPTFLECRDERVFPIDMERLQPDLTQILGFNQIASVQVIGQLNAQKKTTDYHAVEYEPDDRFPGNVKIHFKPHPQKVGFTADDMKGQKPAFADYIGRWQANQKFLFFLVRPDGFGVYRDAAALAREKGYKIGWEPLPDHKPTMLYFGNSVGKTKLG